MRVKRYILPLIDTRIVPPSQCTYTLYMLIWAAKRFASCPPLYHSNVTVQHPGSLSISANKHWTVGDAEQLNYKFTVVFPNTILSHSSSLSSISYLSTSSSSIFSSNCLFSSSVIAFSHSESYRSVLLSSTILNI